MFSLLYLKFGEKAKNVSDLFGLGYYSYVNFTIERKDTMKKNKFLSVILSVAMIGSLMSASVLAEEYTDNEAQGIIETADGAEDEKNQIEILNEEDINHAIQETDENKLISGGEGMSVTPVALIETNIGLMGNLDKNIIVDLAGQKVTLEANRYTDGDIYVAFYKCNGQLVSVKKYSSVVNNIKVDADENAAYAKVMWWDEDLLPNCNVEQIKLKDQYSIKYYIDNNDSYLKSLDIENPNPSEYFSDDGLILQDLIVDGYNFKGWYTAQTGGTRITEIAPGETGNKIFYAQWEKVEYTISFASDMVPVQDLTYKAGEERTLPKPTLDKYTFVGWSDKDGSIWTSIPKGMTGNITLYANWASNRNKAEAVKKLEDPLIFEDSNKGLMLFTYEIGQIKNVPLFETLKLQCANGLITTVSKTETDEISSTQATAIAQTISNATTNSSSWTLSSDWNNSTEVSQSYLDQTGQTREEAETSSKSVTGTYNLTSSSGGSAGITNTASGSFKLASNRSHSDTTTTETGQTFELSVDAKKYGEISAKVPLKGVTLGAKAGYELGVGVDYSNYRKTTNTGTDGWSLSGELSEAYSNTLTASKTWNTSEGFSNSSSASRSSTVSNVVSKQISQQYGYGQSYSEGGSNSQSQALAFTNSKSDEYSSTLTYHTSKINSTTTTFSSTGNTIGNYRMVMAGTVHVFATVGYDIATKSYFVYTYNVLDDKTEEYLDYSFDGTFDDYETSIVPFEIPYFVNEYVNNRIAKTDGLMLDPDTGMIVDYISTGEEPDSIVVIPSYIAVDNNDGTYTSVKVKGIAPGLFKDNKDIIGVQLGGFINKIPDSAFEGCSSLKYIISPGVDKIGNNAFKDCTSLSTFTVPSDITELGENAFKGVPEIKAAASSASIAQAVASSGADKITLDISSIPDNELADMAFDIENITSFEIQGKDKEYKGLSIKSAAETTIINGITFTENTKIPMELSSENVTLDRVTVDCSGYALVLKADETNVSLNRNINLLSTGENAVITKSVNLKNLNSSIIGKLNITGNMLVCGDVSGDRYITFNNGEIIYIADEEYENRLTSHKILFNANGGTVPVPSKTVSLNMAIGELPVPSRDYFTFDGWYTEENGGEKITEGTIMTSLTDTMFYAHWIQNDVSAWINASDVPINAEIVNRKYTYTLTSYTTSNSSSLSGWSQYNSTSAWSDYGNWSGWQDDYVGGSDSRQIDTQSVVSGYNKKTQWIYSRARSPKGDKAYGWQTSYCTIIEGTGWLDYPLEHQTDHSCGAAYGKGFRNADGAVYSGIYWYNEATQVVDDYNSPIYKTQYRYRDRYLIYTYYYSRDEYKESMSYPAENNISNVQEWVQYRIK